MKRRSLKKRSKTVFLLDEGRGWKQRSAKQIKPYLAAFDMDARDTLLAVKMGYVLVANRYDICLKDTAGHGQYNGIIFEGQQSPVILHEGCRL